MPNHPNILLPNALSLEEIHQHYNLAENALSLYYSDKNPDKGTLFLGLTSSEVDSLLEHEILELEKSYSMSVLASIEASFQIDCACRVKARLKDDVSRRFRHIHKQKSKGNSISSIRMSLERDILQTWKEHERRVKTIISEFIAALSYRHWLAHGRYWTENIGRPYDYGTLYSLAERIQESIDLKRSA